MISKKDVFKKIKQMSNNMLSPAPRILLDDIAAEMHLQKERLLVLLMELEIMGVIRINKTQIVSVNLTNYGATQDTVSEYS